MTKKDYILLAAAIHSAYISLSYASVNMGETRRSAEITAETIALALYNDNNHFNHDKFIEACNIK